MSIDKKAPENISQAAVTSGTDNEADIDPKQNESETPLPADDEAPLEEDMSDVKANNSVSNEHPDSGSL